MGEIVWLEGHKKSTGYKMIAFKADGSPVWQRGAVIKY
jgi:hypothetical protein